MVYLAVLANVARARILADAAYSLMPARRVAPPREFSFAE
jgi:hypothetical protein